MATLNRFPLFGLWAAEAAQRAGYSEGEAASLGHAYAVLYAIRARGPYRAKGYKAKTKKVPIARPGAQQDRADRLNFCGDALDIVYVDEQIRGRVGGGALQTPHSFETAVWQKIPAAYREPLRESFRAFWKARSEKEANSSMVYSLYDEWKKTCGAKRFVDLDLLLDWMRKRTPDVVSDEASGAASAAQDA